jgi:hypothetical protein
MTNPQPGSWEHWIIAIKSDGKQGLPGRPDRLPLSAPLPPWVDCHLSHYIDIPTSQSKPKIFKKIILQSDTKLCKGSLEDISQ